jgi:hypothetical protein
MKNNKMAYWLIGIGVILIIIGVSKLNSGSTKELKRNDVNADKYADTIRNLEIVKEKPVANKAATTPKYKAAKAPQQTVDDNYEENKAKGDAFEAYVVKHFRKKYFTLQEWRGDKYVDGTYAISNHFPDLEVSFNFKDVNDHFAIECKWRGYFYNESITWAKDYQIGNYQKYAAKTKLPVYVVIGVAGEPSSPEEIYVVPLNKIKDATLTREELKPYLKEGDDHFYWDYKKQELR